MWKKDLDDYLTTMEIYIDNYKGFTDTVIPFGDVNFFVGENSTGKTAVLNLMEVISHPNFWLMPEFNSNEIELGYFSEMVNQNSSNKKYFAVGSSIGEFRLQSGHLQYIWMKFIEKEHAPEVSECKFIYKSKSVWCKLSEKSVSYQTKELENDVKFSTWVRDFDGFGELVTIETKHVPFFGIIRSKVEDHLKGGEVHDSDQFSFTGSYNRMFWIAPIRAKAKRWYESYSLSYTPEGAHTPLLLKKYQNTNTARSRSFHEAIVEFGRQSGLFDEVRIMDDKPENPFSVNVDYGKLSMNIANVGYGVSQVLPLVVEMLRIRGDSFAIQQPEVHLHPRAQAAFGDLIYKVATKNRNRLIIETHSDYMINRFRLAVNKGKSKVNAQVLFFSRDENGIRVEQMPIDQKGQYVGEVSKKYMEFFLEEELKMLEM